jgi:hypothetical protein
MAIPVLNDESGRSQPSKISLCGMTILTPILDPQSDAIAECLFFLVFPKWKVVVDCPSAVSLTLYTGKTRFRNASGLASDVTLPHVA